jgi:protein-disulfide isomerase
LYTGAMRSVAAYILLTGAALAAVAVGRKSMDPTTLGVPSYRREGPESAAVAVVMFSDFQCPNCAKAEPLLRELLARHPGKTRLYFRHHPLRAHRWSVPAAMAAEAAGIQGKFWPYAAVLFERQKDWSDSQDPTPFFLRVAGELGLDTGRFKADMEDTRRAAFLESDRRAADSLAVNATPTIFIGPRRLVGASQLEESGERFLQLEAGS